MFEGLSLLQFNDKFSTDESCYQYLSDIKWKNDYQCAKCGHRKYFSGKQPCSRCCSKCKYAESVTAHGLFHKMKFPLRKAFYIVFMVVTGKKGISSYELGRKLDLRQKTCWQFKRKVMEAMKSSGEHLLDRHVEVDEFFVGGQEEGKKGRGREKKALVVMAIEVNKFGIHRSYARVIPAADHIELQAFFDVHIDKYASIKTDGWKGYIPLKQEYGGLVSEPSSAKGKAFPLMHRHIMMFKSWLRGIHHHCRHLQAYLDEFNYRFNRLKYPGTLFHNLIIRMMEHPPTTYQKLKLI
jgi:hypothetical protein